MATGAAALAVAPLFCGGTGPEDRVIEASFDISVIDAPACRLGECPIWCDRSNRLWWIDVLTPTLWSFDPGSGRASNHPVRARRIGSIALRESGGLLIACDDGLYSYDPLTGSQEFLVDPEPGIAGHRKNDGRADPAGNFWIGTLRERDYAKVGRLYRVNPSLEVTVEAQDLAIPNGLAFDSDRGRMYYCDTRSFEILVCDYEAKTGRRGKPRSFAKTDAPARPDGSCVDAEGYLWNAEYAGGRLVRFSPSGDIASEISLPVTFPTCCCFGGPMLDEIFVTSAYEPLTADERDKERLAGRLLRIAGAFRGRPEYRVGF